ncbi:MAG: hypothetical protein QOJ39_3044 [Candidatus Eremiobacteraeota bacterium]|jgi:hypothetical protein|nr:hypothetical protein [Candidatus Eremiobacteraeota bacterium]
MPYQIISGATAANGDTLALAVDSNGYVVIADAGSATAAQSWSLIWDTATGNFGMVNLASIQSGTPSVLSATSGQTLSLVPLSGGALANTTTWNVSPGGDALAIRPAFSTSYNLNVAGSGPYRSGDLVIPYDGWGGGQPNEIWTFKAIAGSDYPWYFALVPECAPELCLSVNALEPGALLTIQPPSGSVKFGSEQIWRMSYVIDGTSPFGVLLVNAKTGRAMCTLPSGGPVFTVDEPVGWAAWWIGPRIPETTAVLSSVAHNAFGGLALNVAGDGPYEAGNSVITYPWQGGAPNEVWNVTAVPPPAT